MFRRRDANPYYDNDDTEANIMCPIIICYVFLMIILWTLLISSLDSNQYYLLILLLNNT